VRAFPRQPLTADATDPPIDAVTELPADFSRRKLANIYPAISRSAVAAFMKFQSRALRGDTAGSRDALVAAVAAEPRFIPARIELALIDDHAGNFESAIEQYRAILTYSPNDPLALNNLAYGLAVYRNNPEEALPIAQRATVVAPAKIRRSSAVRHRELLLAGHVTVASRSSRTRSTR
jgi:tetratricopeptide (TPR) repeat protein